MYLKVLKISPSLSSGRSIYFETLVAMVRKHSLLQTAATSSTISSSASSSTLWTTESISRFTSSTEIDFDLAISVLIRHGFLQLAFEVARRKNQLDAFLRRFIHNDKDFHSSSTAKNSFVGSVDVNDASKNISTSGGKRNNGSEFSAFPWKLLLSTLTPSECWTLARFVRGVDGLLEQFLIRADEDRLVALFRVLTSSYALFIRSLDLISSFLVKLDDASLGELSSCIYVMSFEH